MTLLVVSLLVSTPGEPDATEIMRRVLDREDGRARVALVRVSTCRYAKKAGALACAEAPREKLLQSFAKDYGANGKDSRGLSIILEPVAEMGIGFLQYDYEDEEKESDQWIYLSALGKVKRIAAGSTDQPKTGSFFGTEITFEDMEAHKLHQYTYSLLQSETYRGRPCWVIEVVPTEAHRARTSYGKSWVWIDKERDLTLKRILFDRRGRKVKRMAFRDLRQEDGIWVVGRIEVNNLVDGRISTVTNERVALNVQIEDEFLTQRSLTDRAFRGRQLDRFRTIVGR